MNMKGKQYIFLLDKDKCLNKVHTLAKEQIKKTDKRQTKLSDLKSDDAY